MKSILLFFILQASAGSMVAQVSPAKLVAFTISDSLRKNADAVVREDYTRFTVHKIDQATLEIHSIVTILNAEAAHYQVFSVYTDKFQSLHEAEIKVYNALGMQLNKYTKKEMKTFAYGDGLVEDGKLTYFNVTAATYPITIEQSYTIKYSGLLEYPDNIISLPYISKEHFSYVVEVPSELGLRYKIMNSSAVPAIHNSGGIDTYKWELSNLMAIKKDAHSGPADRYFARIMISPNKFKIGGYEGEMTSWKTFGKWFYELISTDNQLSEKGRQTITELVKNVTTNEEKERVIYNYLQHNMRYVSVQLGIGGWKPFKADFVQEKKYGDCKALSNYMQAALAAVGIKSYYAIVNADANATPARTDFPSSPFNHVILCIPHQKDSTWLECTSSTSEFGVLGNFTENRNALLVTENGGVLVSTPKSNAIANSFFCKTSITINEDGSGKMETTLAGTGEFKQVLQHNLNQRSSDEQIKYFVNGLSWKQPDACKVVSGNQLQVPYTASASMDYGQLYTFRAGSKMFLPMRYYNFFDEAVADNKERKQDYFFAYPYVKSDTTVFVLPAGYLPEDLPKEKSIRNSFAKYNCTYHWNAAERKIAIYAKLEILNQMVTAADYNILMSFKKELDADINQRLVIKK